MNEEYIPYVPITLTVDGEKIDLHITLGEYDNGQPAYMLVEAETGEYYSDLSYNLVDFRPERGNEFLLTPNMVADVRKALIEEGYIKILRPEVDELGIDLAKMEILYIVDDLEHYKGSVINTMSVWPWADFTAPARIMRPIWEDPLDLQQYHVQRNDELILRGDDPHENMYALPWSKIDAMVDKYYRSKCGNWTECTEERYWEMLEVLPPMGWRDIAPGINFFQISEASEGCNHAAFIKDYRVKGKTRYYEGMENKFDSNEKLLESFKKSTDDNESENS